MLPAELKSIYLGNTHAAQKNEATVLWKIFNAPCTSLYTYIICSVFYRYIPQSAHDLISADEVLTLMICLSFRFYAY